MILRLGQWSSLGFSFFISPQAVVASELSTSQKLFAEKSFSLSPTGAGSQVST